MAEVTFTRHLERFLSAPPQSVAGDTVACVLDVVFDANPQLRDTAFEEFRVGMHGHAHLPGIDPVGSGDRLEQQRVVAH